MTARWPIAFCVMLAVTVGILGYFHDRFWWPPDEGAYAYVASRILAGDVLNRDIQDIHMGYVNFANALALHLFGQQLVSLRLPLVAAGLIQACIVFLLFKPRGMMGALIAATALTSLSFVQFLNPTAHWYSLFLTISVIGCLAWIPRESWWRLFIIGFLLMVLFLFRQLSGIIAGIGVMAFLLNEAPRGASGRDLLLGRSLTIILTAGLAGYLLTKTDITAFLLFGIWPLAILAWGGFKAHAANGYITRQLPILVLGGLIGALPLIAYHIHHGSLETWYADTVLSAVRLSDFAFISQPRYLNYAVLGIHQIITMESFDAVLSGLFWFVIVLIPPILGIAALISLARDGETGPAAPPLPFLAVFYSLVSAHYQIPIYLFYTVGLSLAGLIWLVSTDAIWRRAVMHGCAIFLAAAGLYYQAGQPLSRGIEGIVEGQRGVLVQSDQPVRTGLSIEAVDIATYKRIVALVEKEAGQDQTILALPVNPEIYFLTNRRNPFRFFNSALGILDKATLDDVLRTMKERPPQLVFYRAADKYNTELGNELMAYVRTHYRHLESFDGFDIYRFPSRK